MIDSRNFSINVFHSCQQIDISISGPKLERLEHLKQALTYVDITGSILEFGVFQGKTLRLIANFFKNEPVWGFDSFEGLPEDWTKNEQGPIEYSKGHFSVSAMPKVPDNVNLVKGWFNETLPEWLKNNTENIKFLHLDADLYSSTKDVLTLLNSRIVPGTVIVFDEMYPWRNINQYQNWAEGEYRALKEWLEIHNREFVPLLRNRYNQCSMKVYR